MICPILSPNSTMASPKNLEQERIATTQGALCRELGTDPTGLREAIRAHPNLPSLYEVIANETRQSISEVVRAILLLTTDSSQE